MVARTRKPHPADIANANIVANAVRFEIALFLGVGRYAADSAETLEDARMKAARLAAMHPNGRRPLIYAVTADGRSGLVTGACLSNTKEDTMKTYAKKFNAQRAAKAAGHSLDDVEIVKTRDGFTYRVKGAADADQESAAAKPEEVRSDGHKAAKTGLQHATPTTRTLGMRAAIEEAARRGKLPAPPDFSAPTHKRFRNKLAAVVELAKAGDLDGLRAFEINPVSSSPKAIARYRDLCVVALEARGA
jgi:hypothetical protein